jgi:hypothetical protein
LIQYVREKHGVKTPDGRIVKQGSVVEQERWDAAAKCWATKR